MVTRRQLVGGTPCPAAKGRLLGFEIDACFFDGVAPAETEGFFDDEDLPPWDTWVAFDLRSGRLVSWVPDALVDLADKGVKVHFADAYAWMSPQQIEELRGVLDE